MDYYYALKNLKDSEIDSFVKDRLESLEEESKNKSHFLGYQLGESQRSSYMEDINNHAIDIRCFHKGYLKKGTKIVFGLSITENLDTSNRGNYYYLNDQQYFYDFCHFIKNYDIYDEFQLFDLILVFLKQYFGINKKCSRQQMFNILYDENGQAYPLNVEHDINWFKSMGNAMCSEYTVMAQNILSFLGFDVYAVIGQDKIGDNPADNHAYNMISILEDGNDEPTNMLIDFFNSVDTFDINYNKLDESPFIGYLDEFDDNFVHSFVAGDKELHFQDYSFYKIGDVYVQLGLDRERKYYIGNEIIMHSDNPQKKKRS